MPDPSQPRHNDRSIYQVATRLQHDRRNLEERLRQEHAERAQELEWRVAVEVDARTQEVPGLKTEVERRDRIS